MTTFDFDPVASADALAHMASAPDGLVALDGTQWAPGAMGALMRAEFLAASAGVIPSITLEDGTQAIASVGAARDVIDRAPESVQTLYLATHGIVRQTHAKALVWDGQTPMLQAGDDLEDRSRAARRRRARPRRRRNPRGRRYFIHQDTIEAEGRNFRTTSILNSTLELARKQLEQTGKIESGDLRRLPRARRHRAEGVRRTGSCGRSAAGCSSPQRRARGRGPRGEAPRGRPCAPSRSARGTT